MTCKIFYQKALLDNMDSDLYVNNVSDLKQ